MTAKIISGLVCVTLLLIFIIASQYLDIGTLHTQILELQNKSPQTVTVTEHSVEYIYKDAKPIVINKPPEGSVTVNLESYNKLYSEIDRLRSEIEIAKRDTTIIYNVVNNVPTRVDSLNIEINNIQNILKNPEQNKLINIEYYGKEFMPIIGSVYGGKLSPVIGAKIFYYDLYGVVVGSSTEQIGIGISRYCYDLLPFMNNTQVILMGGIPYKKGNGNISVGIVVGL
jgi:hypothetical protein